ncbi:hypothetical protein Nepgr_028722 [Nepenthes gracilis]|uniref:Uncharacterized protein n=1 Tax=Nepenthes gracilis TaxID=150966 RepID=A0AAD3Y4C5_NEPGR|nr:hypothetical protein Nepgr_028722 [Nepenthes gracilis]
MNYRVQFGGGAWASPFCHNMGCWKNSLHGNGARGFLLAARVAEKENPSLRGASVALARLLRVVSHAFLSGRPGSLTARRISLGFFFAFWGTPSFPFFYAWLFGAWYPETAPIYGLRSARIFSFPDSHNTNNKPDFLS